MSVYYKEFITDDEAIRGIQEIKSHGIQDDDIYVITHENYRTEKLAEMASANTIGVAEEGLGTAIANAFKTKGEELRAKLEHIGFSLSEAVDLEQQLDEHKVIVVVKNKPAGLTL
ncbi:general stress protein [Paenisporosarcina indica]|uniref:general stress protein n=1 Tax=Paenisporosarcina indica TaxID=650093 RepID=UPI00094F52E8|nr:general stress protein [Paenisporosarcina indica]